MASLMCRQCSTEFPPGPKFCTRCGLDAGPLIDPNRCHGPGPCQAVFDTSSPPFCVSCGQERIVTPTAAEHKFLDFAKDYNWEEVKRLVLAQPALVGVMPTGLDGTKRWSALHQAAFHGNADAVRFLLDHNAPVDAKDFRGMTPLDVATTDVKSILQSHIPFSQRLSQGVYAAAKAGDSEALLHLLLEGADPNQQHDDGYTPLMTASEAGHVGIVNVLTKEFQSTNVNARNAYGQTALHFAAQNGRRAVVQALLQTSRIEVEALCSGKTPAEIARRAGFHEVADMLSAAACDAQMARCMEVVVNDPIKYDSLRARFDALATALGVDKEDDDEKEETEGPPLCSICLLAKANTILTPCHHASFCGDCAQGFPGGPCPLCRRQVEATHQIYFS